MAQDGPEKPINNACRSNHPDDLKPYLTDPKEAPVFVTRKLAFISNFN